MTGINGNTYVHSSLSGVGSTVIEHPAATETTLRSASYISFAPLYERAYAGEQLVLGILLIVLGFFVHGLLRTNGERKVHVTSKPRKQTQRFFFVELSI